MIDGGAGRPLWLGSLLFPPLLPLLLLFALLLSPLLLNALLGSLEEDPLAAAGEFPDDEGSAFSAGAPVGWAMRQRKATIVIEVVFTAGFCT